MRSYSFRHRLPCLWLGLAIALFSGAGALAAVTGNIQVEVRDVQGEPLPGATVVITSPAQLGERSLRSVVLVRFSGMIGRCGASSMSKPTTGTT